MADGELVLKVGALRERGLTPKAIAKTLGMRQSAVSELVRIHAASRGVVREAKLVGAWMSAGWSGGLSWEGHDDWCDDDDTDTGSFGLVSVLVAREHRYGKVTACGYLVDTHCLGVKDALGPRVMDRVELTMFMHTYFANYGAPPIAAPLELAQQLVLGAVAFAQGLGFAPARDFEACREHLGQWSGPSQIRFGCEGRPTFVNGPHDDVASILRALEASVGRGNFDFVRLG
jgi:hypothetical protein